MKLTTRHSFHLLWEPHKYHLLFEQTKLKLDVYRQRVQDCKDIQAASEFARWLRTSGLVRLFEKNPLAAPLCVNGSGMDAQIGDLILLCGEKWKHGAERVVEVSEIERLNYKVDVLADALRGLLPNNVHAVTSHPSLPPVLLSDVESEPS